MKFYVMTLFPEMIESTLNTSIIGRAIQKGLISLEAVNIRDYTRDKHGRVDDYPYGGGAGMLIQAQPVYDCHQDICKKAKNKNPRTIYVTPQGRKFTQSFAEELAKEEEIVFLCGHYEGIDERVLEEVVTDYVSIGDYVLTGGELPVMVMTDAISRLVPGVLNNDFSAETETFHNDLLEYPQYSRPEIWHEKKVPEVLLSGNHKKISEWRLEQSKERTKANRPDLYAKYQKKQKLWKQLSTKKREYIHMMEQLVRGSGEILYWDGFDVVIRNTKSNIYFLSVENEENALPIIRKYLKDANMVVTSQEYLNDLLVEECDMEVHCKCAQVCYTKKESLPVKFKDIRPLEKEHIPYVCEHYELGDESYILDRIEKKQMFGAFLEDRLVGFVGMHDDGSTGLLYVDENCRNLGIGNSLECYMINAQIEQGFTPYGHLIEGNEISAKLQEKLGLLFAKEPIWWLGKKDI